MSFKDFMSEDRRLAILRLLHDQPGMALNDSVLVAVLERVGHAVARDTVRADMAWLQDVDVITLDEVGGRVLVATLRQRGVDVVLGRSVVPGIRRPSPRT